MDKVKLLGKPVFHKFMNNLNGIMEGVEFDHKINDLEIEYIRNLVNEYDEFSNSYPLNQFLPVLKNALLDGIITEEEGKDIKYLLSKLLRDSDYYDYITSSMQFLHGIIQGILADHTVNDVEIYALKNWIDNNQQLKSLWPFDELESLLTHILSDGKITKEENELLSQFLFDFTVIDDQKVVSNLQADKTFTQLSAICALDPFVEFENKKFVITGEFTKLTRAEIKAEVEKRNGKVIDAVSRKINYVVVGNNGSKTWSYFTYGRKIEEAVSLRKEGHPIVIVNEIDFLDYLNE